MANSDTKSHADTSTGSYGYQLPYFALYFPPTIMFQGKTNKGWKTSTVHFCNSLQRQTADTEDETAETFAYDNDPVY